MSMLTQAARFARSPQGRRLIAQATSFVQSPEGKRKLNEARERVIARGTRKVPPRSQP